MPFVTTPDAVTLAMLELAAVTRATTSSTSARATAASSSPRRAASARAASASRSSPNSCARAASAPAPPASHDRVEFREQDLFRTDLGAATVVTMYLLPDVNLQLRPRLLALAPGTRIVSHDWDLGDWTPDRTVTVDVPDKALGRDKFSRVHLWIVPARVHGRWCADGASLEIVQRFQRFSATLASAGSAAPATVFDGRIEASTLRGDGLHALACVSTARRCACSRRGDRRANLPARHAAARARDRRAVRRQRLSRRARGGRGEYACATRLARPGRSAAAIRRHRRQR